MSIHHALLVSLLLFLAPLHCLCCIDESSLLSHSTLDQDQMLQLSLLERDVADDQSENRYKRKRLHDDEADQASITETQTHKSNRDKSEKQLNAAREREREREEQSSEFSTTAAAAVSGRQPTPQHVPQPPRPNIETQPNSQPAPPTPNPAAHDKALHNHHENKRDSGKQYLNFYERNEGETETETETESDNGNAAHRVKRLSSQQQQSDNMKQQHDERQHNDENTAESRSKDNEDDVDEDYASVNERGSSDSKRSGKKWVLIALISLGSLLALLTGVYLLTAWWKKREYEQIRNVRAQEAP